MCRATKENKVCIKSPIDSQSVLFKSLSEKMEMVVEKSAIDTDLPRLARKFRVFKQTQRPNFCTETELVLDNTEDRYSDTFGSPNFKHRNELLHSLLCVCAQLWQLS